VNESPSSMEPSMEAPALQHSSAARLRNRKGEGERERMGTQDGVYKPE
jgi:hypothetical protein